MNEQTSEIYFEKVVYDTRRIIWVGTSGQLILKYKISDDEALNIVYKMWLPSYTPDFRFGAPYDDQKGSFINLVKLKVMKKVLCVISN